MTETLTMMLIVGLTLSFTILGVFIWGAKQGQFDDGEKMMSGLLFDTQEDLNDAIKKEEKIKKAKQAKGEVSIKRAKSEVSRKQAKSETPKEELEKKE